jgi:diacylglycerol kinase family enzyme
VAGPQTDPQPRDRGLTAGVNSFLIIANPAAGRRAELRRASQVCELLRAGGKRAEIELTAGPGDAYRLAREAVRAGVEVVVGAGGDGTLQEIGRALESTDVALGIIPAGCCTHLDHAAVETFNTRSLEIETTRQPDWICADGESLCQTPCRLEVQPNALRMVVESVSRATVPRPQ